MFVENYYRKHCLFSKYVRSKYIQQQSVVDNFVEDVWFLSGASLVNQISHIFLVVNMWITFGGGKN